MKEKTFKKILVFNVNWLGDVIFTTPVFRALKEYYPGSTISCLAVPRVREILECCPAIDEVLIYDERGRQRGLVGKIRLIKELQDKKFDIVFLLHRSWSRALLVWLAGIPERVGYPTKHRGLFLTHWVSPLSGIVHRSDYYLRVIEDYGVPVHNRGYELSVLSEARGAVTRLLEQAGVHVGDYLVVVNPGGNWDLKRWPKENFAELTRRLTQELQVKVVISGAEKDIPLAREIAEKSKVQPLVLAGKTTVKQVIALMARATLVISADSGPLHIAHSVGTPVVGIFGATLPSLTGVRGKNRAIILRKDLECNQQPCYSLDCPDNQCMKIVTVDDVVVAAKQLLKSL
jgi:heptosyltransferase II